METTTKVKVLRISSKLSEASPISLTEVPLINVGPGGISWDECNGFERQLGHIPDMQSFSDPETKTFSWAHRTLFSLTHGQTTYMMYVCQDEQSGLPHNGYLEGRFKGVENTGRAPQIDPVVVYGDVCIFKMEQKSKESDDSERARYIDMDEDFALKAKWDWGWGFAVLRNLLILSPKRE